MTKENENSILKSAGIKIICTGLILGLVFACSSSYLAYQYMEKTKEQRLLYIKQAVQIARNSIEPILVDYINLNISMENAVEQVRNLIRRMVYNDHIGKNYIFMSSYDGIMLVQPFEPEKENTDVWDLKDSHGVYIIRALVKAAKSKEGQGYVTYYYQRPGQSSPQEKISFVIGIPELECYIGTGQYMADLNKNQSVYIMKIVGLISVLMILLFFLVWSSMKEIHTQNIMLRKAEHELKAIFQNTFQFIGTLSPDGELKKANRAALDFIGQEENSVIGKPFWDTPWWRDDFKARLKKAVYDCSKGIYCRFEVIYIRQDQEKIYVDFSLTPICDEKENVVFLLAEGRDVTEQTKARNDLIKEKSFFNYLIESLPGLFFLYKQENEKYILKKWNQEQYERVLGFSEHEMKNAPMTMFFSERDLPGLDKSVTQLIGTGSISVQLDLQTKDKRSVPFFFLGKHFEHAGDSFIVGTGVELTEKIKAEEEKKELQALLAQSQKMEAMGTLAGGIAHDFNNILSAILGFAELIQRKLPSGDPIKEMQGKVIKAAIRAKNLVEQILVFSRQSNLEMKPVKPELIIKEALKLLRSSIPATIEIKQNIPRDSGTILADATQIHQIIMNLCTNAYHAMRESGGILAVSLSERKIRIEDFVYSEFSLEPGTYLLLEVSDTGMGMDYATLNKIFDPYFTTKEKGEGTGLGLSVVHGIVKNCGGKIMAYSDPGQGSSFHVYFPKIADSGKDDANQHDPVPTTGSERILLVDDDLAILEMMEQSLTNLGYKIIAFSSSLEALDEFSADPDGFDLVITDMTMPQMTGLDLSKKMFDIKPQTRIILCTGYSELITREKAQSTGIKAFLFKPILCEELSRTIREVLDADS